MDEDLSFIEEEGSIPEEEVPELTAEDILAPGKRKRKQKSDKSGVSPWRVCSCSLLALILMVVGGCFILILLGPTIGSLMMGAVMQPYNTTSAPVVIPAKGLYLDTLSTALNIEAGTIRAVVERRQQIGILRAIGFQRGMVQSVFLAEGLFVSGLGTVIGYGLALTFAYNLYLQVAAGQGLAFLPPWPALIGIAVAIVFASLLTTWLPARATSKVTIAEALRYE